MKLVETECSLCSKRRHKACNAKEDPRG